MQKLLTLTLALCVVLLFLGLLPIHGEQEIYSSVLRLHVIASSDSEEDQALKLEVRDAVLTASEPILRDCHTKEEAAEALLAHQAELIAAAEAAICRAGRSDSVTISLDKEVYPTKSYESLCFPAGEYLSLQVRIGVAEGQNWWCVLFPPLCLSSATAERAEEAFVAVGLTEDQYRIITETDSPTYTVRFRILEVLEEALR